MVRDEFIKYLDNYQIQYEEIGKWLNINTENCLYKNLPVFHDYLIFNGNGILYLYDNNLKNLPENIIFNITSLIYFDDYNLEYLPKNIIITKNVKSIKFLFNKTTKIKYYSNYFSKIDMFKIEQLIINLQFEKIISKFYNIFDIEKVH